MSSLNDNIPEILRTLTDTLDNDFRIRIERDEDIKDIEILVIKLDLYNLLIKIIDKSNLEETRLKYAKYINDTMRLTEKITFEMVFKRGGFSIT